MWVKGKLYGQSKAIAKHSLGDLYGSFKADMRNEIADLDGHSPAQLWAEVAPHGNIYRYNALHAEHLKHQEDLRAQVTHLANQYAALLDDADTTSGENLDAADRRVARLIQQLMITECGTVDGDVEDAKGAIAIGYPPLCEFLCPDGPERHLCGLLLLPKANVAKQKAMKAKAFAFLIAAIQVLGPLMIFARNWRQESNHFVDGTLWGQITWAEFICLGGMEDSALTIMGTMFLILVLEIVRNYAGQEIENCGKSRRLALDSFWINFGQVVNILSLLCISLTMPILFWSEMKPKDIVYDSLGLLFIFTLDDLAGDACGFLGMENTDFQQMAAWMLALLSHCPVYLRDVTNPEAKSCAEIWKIHVTPNGVLSAETGQPCQTRLSCNSSTSTPLLGRNNNEIFDSKSFDYCVVANGSKSQLPSMSCVSGTMPWLWHIVVFLLGVLEIVLPFLFFTLNKPCGKQVAPIRDV